MKKYFSGTLAFILAISLCVLQSFTTAKTTESNESRAGFNWYPVNALSQISSTTPVYTNMTKAAVVSVDLCKDQVSPDCLFGTNGSVTLGQDISGQPASQRIRQHN
jgi:hypothetical protein